MIVLLLLSVFAFYGTKGVDIDISKPIGLQLPSPRRSSGVVGVIDGSGTPLIVVAGGEKDSNSALDDLLVFDMLKNTKQIYHMPGGARDEPSIGVVNDLVLIAGGNNGTAYAYDGISETVDVFDVTKRQFLKAAKISPRKYMTASCTRFVCAFIGGRERNSNGDIVALRTVDAFDIRTNSWTSFQLLSLRYSIASVAAGDKIYVTGGGLSFSERVFNVEVLDFSDSNSGLWTSKVDGSSSIPYSMYSHSGALANKNIPIFAGGIRRSSDASAPNNGEQPFDTCLMKQGTSWSKQPFGTPQFSTKDQIYDMPTASVGNYALFVGGTQSFLGTNGTNFMYRYDMASGWVRSVFDFGEPLSHRGVGAVTFGNNAFVVAAGGDNNAFETVSTVVVLTFSNDATINSTCTNCANGKCVSPERCILPATTMPMITTATMTSQNNNRDTTDTATSSQEQTSSDGLMTSTTLTKKASTADSILLPAIIGAVGGLVLIGATILMIVLLIRRNRRIQMMSNNGNGSSSSNIAMQPTPTAADTTYISQGYMTSSTMDGSGSSTTGYQTGSVPPTTQYGALTPRQIPAF